MTANVNELGFWDHLEELRWRLLRMIVYIIVAAALSWIFREALLEIMRYPAELGAEMAGEEDFSFRIFEVAGGFILMIQIALVSGVILAAPAAIVEMWLFVEPALEPHERKWVILVIPLAILLFLSGVAVCYLIAPRAFEFFLRFNRSMGVEVELTLPPYIFFLMRMLLVFGISFQLPLVLSFLSAVGIVTQQGLLNYWRHAVLVLFIFGALATPADPATMILLAVPLVVLYMLSVWLAGLFEKRRARRDAEASEDAGDDDEALDASE